jgi:hypothetical protein
MKDQILKIAKVKSEKEFYKKYPSEEAFMKAHGKAFKKAAMGSKMVNDQLHQLTSWDNVPMAQAGLDVSPIKSFQSPTMPTMAGLDAKLSDASFQQQAIKNVEASAPGAGFDFAGAGMAALNAIPGIIAGAEAIGAQKKKIKKADQASRLSGLAAQAAGMRERVERKYVRPEDSLLQPGQMGNPYGAGTNYLAAENGTMIGGNPTQIQNTYANTGDLYQDLGYEPLSESVYKQYRHGGEMPKAELGEYFQDSGQAQIGSSVGSAIGNAILPGVGGVVGGLLGKVGGNLLGGAKDARELAKFQAQTESNQQQAAFQNTLQGQFSGFMEDGGKVGNEYKWVSNTWQPQVIAKFGDYDVKDLLKPPHDADMLRSGGHLAQVHYTPPSAEALFTGRPALKPLTMNTGGRLPSTNMMFDTDKYPRAEDGVQMAMGGDLEIGDGGHLETLSYNPNLPGGEIGMFRGASHDNGGIKTKYGENEVEVEGNEPVVKLQDGGSTENLVVFGNIKINKNIADLMGDPKAKGKKFKTYIADVAKNDAKQLKRINKGLEIINDATDNSARDHLAMNTGQAMLDGAKAWQKINAAKIKEAGLVQDSIHQVANEYGVKSDKLAEGKLEKETDPSMMGKNGKKMKKAQEGIETLKGLDDEALLDPEHPERMEILKNYYSLNNADREMMKRGMSKPGFMGLGATDLEPVVVTANRSKSIKDLSTDIIPYERKGIPLYDPLAPQMFTGNMPDIQMAASASEGEGKGGGFSLKNINWEKLGDIGKTALSYAAPWLRPSNANEPLSPDQLYPEYFALANNQIEPVKAQTFQPMLDTPYDISLNDQINAVDSQARAAIRAAGQNPASQALIMTQALETKNKILGEQSRINQANKMGVYAKNRELLNDAQLKNLGILDNQYVRQSQARSNTKEQALEALKSIAAKTAQQRAVNRKLGIMENMYNYRYSPSGRAYNVNTPAQFNLSGSMNQSASTKTDPYGNPMYPIYNPKTGKIKGYSVGQSESTVPDDLDPFQKNGGKTSKTKARNSSIVKALKNL